MTTTLNKMITPSSAAINTSSFLGRGGTFMGPSPIGDGVLIAPSCAGGHSCREIMGGNSCATCRSHHCNPSSHEASHPSLPSSWAVEEVIQMFYLGLSISLTPPHWFDQTRVSLLMAACCNGTFLWGRLLRIALICACKHGNLKGRLTVKRTRKTEQKQQEN